MASRCQCSSISRPIWPSAHESPSMDRWPDFTRVVRVYDSPARFGMNPAAGLPPRTAGASTLDSIRGFRATQQVSILSFERSCMFAEH